MVNKLLIGGHKATPPPTSATEGNSTAQGSDEDNVSEDQHILVKLGIPPYLAQRRVGQNLPLAYKKYLGMLKAVENYKDMVKTGTWTGSPMSMLQLRDLFFSKSVYHSHYSNFDSVEKGSLMVQWLEKESGKDEPSDLEVWGRVRKSYNFQDLKDLIKEHPEKVRAKKDKGKEKEKEKGKGKGKGKAQASSSKAK